MIYAYHAVNQPGAIAFWVLLPVLTIAVMAYITHGITKRPTPRRRAQIRAARRAANRKES